MSVTAATCRYGTLPLEEVRRAAVQGDPAAQFALGLRCYDARRENAACRWFLAAAERGHPRAQLTLGLAYMDGAGVPKRATEAFRWCSAAAHQGLAVAQATLGRFYRDGYGVDQDYVAAYLWLWLGSAHRSLDKECLRLGKHLTAEQRNNAVRRAQTWTPTLLPSAR